MQLVAWDNCSQLIAHLPTDLVDSYNATLSTLLDKHAPFKTNSFLAKPPNPWSTPALSKLESASRHLERIWFHTRSSNDLKLFLLPPTLSLLHYPCQKVFNSSLISSSSSDLRKLCNSNYILLHRKPISQLPSTIDSKSIPNMFASFFSEKVLKIYPALKSHVTTSPYVEPCPIPINLTYFSPSTAEGICKLYICHPTPSLTLILYLVLFWNSAYQYSSLP